MTDSIFPIFAIGLGFREQFRVNFTKIFTPREPTEDDGGNLEKLQDLLRVLQKSMGYTEGNAVIDLLGVDLDALHQVFMETQHYASANFVEEAMKQKSMEHYDAVIVVMTEDIPATCIEEESLIIRLKVDKKPFIIQST